mmetsp:Transcript_8640/g.9816  ORF Transcript_8640/g.9816 Transcript_8640/m.9816 type:complete len:179 (-) Transcript_8640:561-1097(-)
MVAFRINGIWAKAFADDVVCICESAMKTRQTIDLMTQWPTKNKMSINQGKPGLMRILLGNEKCIQLRSSLNIPEVRSYKYLSVHISQSLTFKTYDTSLRSIEQALQKKFRLLKPSLVSVRSRLRLFSTIVTAKMSFAAAVVCCHDISYRAKWQGLFYRCLKSLLGVRVNVGRKALFCL